MSAPPHILAVDDNPADLELVRFAFEAVGAAVRISTASDGVKAREAIERLALSGDCPRLILLDLNMPRSGGYDVLEHLRRSGSCRASRVVVLTTSDANADRARCFELGVHAVKTKPADIDGLIELARSLTGLLEDKPA